MITIAVWVYEGKSISNLYFGAIRKKKGGFGFGFGNSKKKFASVGLI